MSVKYETIPGQYIHVIGSIPELGGWKDENMCKLEWTEDHVWKTTKPIKTQRGHFLYKYVVMEEGRRIKVEEGIDRIADVLLLSKQQTNQKYVELIDEWETFKIHFTVYPPLMSDRDSLIIQSNKLSQLENGPLLMSKVKKPIDWYGQKFGEDLRPYEKWVTL